MAERAATRGDTAFDSVGRTTYMSAKVWCCAPEGRAPLQTQFSMALITRMQRGSIQSFFEVCFAKTRSVVGRVVFSLPGVFGRMDGGARWTGRPTQLLSVVERHARRTAYGAFVTHAPGGARAVHDRAFPARLTPAHEWHAPLHLAGCGSIFPHRERPRP